MLYHWATQEHLDYTRFMWNKSAVYKVQEQQEKPDPLISYVIVYTCYPSIPHRTGTRSYVDLSSMAITTEVYGVSTSNAAAWTPPSKRFESGSNKTNINMKYQWYLSNSFRIETIKALNQRSSVWNIRSMTQITVCLWNANTDEFSRPEASPEIGLWRERHCSTATA